VNESTEHQDGFDAVAFFRDLAPDTPETRRVGKQEWARLLLTEQMRIARKQAGLTQGQVAEKLGVTQGWISRLEHADHDHTLESVIAYLDAVGADLEFAVVPAASSGTGPEALRGSLRV
jgi:DNA-binding XRE family transcriptional regulator